MSTRIAPADPARVLVVVATPLISGHAVLDGYGLAPGSFATWNHGFFATEDARRRSFARRLRCSIRLHRPAVVVLGIPRFDRPRVAALRSEAARVAVACGLRVVVRRVRDARRLLVGMLRGPGDDPLARNITVGFFPELERFRCPEHSKGRRYHAPAFEAVALGIHELALRSPFSAAAVARSEAFAMGSFEKTVTASAQGSRTHNL